MALGKFQRPTRAPGAAAPGKIWKGIKSAQPREPLIHVGSYRLCVTECTRGYNQGNDTHSFKVKFKIVALHTPSTNHKVGDEVSMVYLISGKSLAVNAPRIKSFVMAASGFATDESYDEFDPEGDFIDACMGAANSYSEQGITIIGALVDCDVRRGNDVLDPNGAATGDYYRECKWTLVEEQGAG